MTSCSFAKTQRPHYVLFLYAIQPSRRQRCDVAGWGELGGFDDAYINKLDLAGRNNHVAEM